MKAFYTINGKTTDIDLTGYKSGLDKKIIFNEVGVYKLTISAKDRSNAPVEKTFTVEYNDRNVEIKLYADGKEVKEAESFSTRSLKHRTLLSRSIPKILSRSQTSAKFFL